MTEMPKVRCLAACRRLSRESCSQFVNSGLSLYETMARSSNFSEAERKWVARQRAHLCKHGHLRHDARVYGNPNGSLWLDCTQCVRDRVNAYRRRMASLAFQAR
jgi:hypothetical protein